MKIIKSVLIMLVLFSLFMLTTSCEFSSPPVKYDFWRQDRSEVDKVEICDFNDYPLEITPIVELSEEEAEEMLDSIANLELGMTFGDFNMSFDPVVVCITYADGEREIISFDNIGFISENGNLSVTPYLIKEYSRTALFEAMSKYLDPEIIKEHLGKDYEPMDWIPKEEATTD